MNEVELSGSGHKQEEKSDAKRGKSKGPDYVIGIDLGTTNCAVAYASLVKGKPGYGQVRSFPVDQLVAPGQTEACNLLPSTIYLSGAHELPADALRLPWSLKSAPPDTAEHLNNPASQLAISAVVGQLARNQGAKVPGRLVTSTKSWLCYGGVDRTAQILPWGAAAEIPRISPVDASAQILRHIRDSWNFHHPKALLEDQEVVLTVPASFDEAARALTLQAALDAGLPESSLVLLEEPQAAFHDYLASHGDDLFKSKLGDSGAWEFQQDADTGEELILVVDVGGGTTDLTLISRSFKAKADGNGNGRGNGTGNGREEPATLRRIAVGEHILLGGDNMDMALAHMVEERLTGRRGSLDPERWATLCHNCRSAKEALLGSTEIVAGKNPADNAAHGAQHQTYTVVLPGRGSKLLGGSLSATITREEVERVVLEGFFPDVPFDGEESGTCSGETADGVDCSVGASAHTAPNVQSALSEWGLPYAAEPAITRHVAAFLHRHGVGRTGKYPMPTAILLNGGVFKAEIFAERLVNVVAKWVNTHTDEATAAGGADSKRRDGASRPMLRVLQTDEPDGAVARGAAQYGLVKRGMGLRIEARTARAYYVGVTRSSSHSAQSRSSQKGNQLVGLCILPRNHDPSIPVHLKERVFNLWVGRPVRFMLYTSTTDLDSKLGDEVEIGRQATLSIGGEDVQIQTQAQAQAQTEQRLVPLPPVQTIFPGGEGGRAQIPVTLKAVPTELGLVEIWCVAVDRNAQWKLEFNLRGPETGGDEVGNEDGGQQESLQNSAGYGADEVQAHGEGAATGGPAATTPERPVNSGLGVSAKSLAAAADHINLFFGRTPVTLDPKEVKRVFKSLEVALHMKRENWQLPLLRELWEMLRPGIKRRRRSPDHETSFFSMAGYFLRPGFGFPFDDWRVGELAAILPEGVQYGSDPRTWQAWWVMWRRVVGGLDQNLQETLLKSITPWVRPELGLSRPKGQKPQGIEEMIRLVAALERINPAFKADWGKMFLEQLLAGQSPARSGWALARLGARVPLYGSAHLVVDRDVVSDWVESLLGLDWTKVDNASFAAAHLCRMSGDRHRDLDMELRNRVADRLQKVGVAPIMRQMVLQPVKLESKEQGQFYGESLPLGLTLLK